MMQLPEKIRKSTRFFMPGHKGRGKISLLDDVTELDGMDDLHCPTGMIKKAQDKAARTFGAKETFFLVNGSTAGNHAMLGSACRPGDKVIVAAGCHVSVINAMVLFDLTPIFVYPKYNLYFDMYEDLKPAELESALVQNPDATAVFITSPTYFGVCSDIAGLKKVTQKYDIPLLVDEAHGAHLCFSDNLPPSSMQSGADACVQSAHKTLPSLTQTAFLHNNTLDSFKIQENLKILQSSSPSYLFMSSLDKAAEFSREKLERIIEECRGMSALSGDNIDPTRLVFNFGENVGQVKKHLEDKGILVEMTTSCCIVAIATVNNTIKELRSLKKEVSKFKAELVEHTAPPKIVMAMQPRRAYFSKIQHVKGTDAVGKIAARSIFKPVPSIPLVPVGGIIPAEVEGEVCVVCEE